MASKVLLVEDDNNLREIYEARLQAEGYNIISAKDGEEALVIAKAEIPDLIISDVMMPKISGFEMLDILRNTDGLKETKVIMLTALGQSEDKLRANSLGANRYLVKSQVTLEDIVKAAHELLDDDTSPTAFEPAQQPAIPVAPPVSTMAPPVATAPMPPTSSTTLPPSQATVVADAASVVQAPASPVPVVAATPTPEPVAAPTPTVVPISTLPPEPTPAVATPAVSAATPPLDASTTAEEQATMQAQIEKFVEEPVAPSTAPNEAQSMTTDDDNNTAVMDSALKSLEVNETPPESDLKDTTPDTNEAKIIQPEAKEPELDSLGNTKVVIANKKTIEPLDSVEKPNINDLLAAEEAKNIMGAGLGANPVVTSSDNSSVESSAAAATPSPAAAAKPASPATPGGVDPNDIAL